MSSGPSEAPSIPERSLNRQVVLEEEEYTEALSRIIARDFFPSLVHLDATNEYLDALRTRDPHLINASVRRLEEINVTPVPSARRWGRSQTPSQTPFGMAAETPLLSVRGEPPQKRAKYDMDMSLDEFQARYTSEDNSSFTKILDEENRIRKEKWGWAWEAQKWVENQQAKMIENRETMLIEPPTATGVREKFRIEAPQPAGLIRDVEESDEGKKETTEGEDEKAVFLASKNASTEDDPLDVMAPQKDTRAAGVDGWKFKARNSLMFTPDADISPYHLPSKPSEAEVNPKAVNHTSTRLSEYEHGVGSSRATSAPPSPTRSRIDAAITGTPYHPSSPKERGFSLVPNLPSPTPAELGPAALKQLMTWGTLNSTPRIISQTGDPADLRTPFHIPDISAREAVAHKLSDNASKSLRAKAEMFGPSSRMPRTAKTPLLGKKGSMAPPTMTPRRSEAAGNLTPAARRLLQRTTMGTAASRRAEAMERSAGWDLGAKGKERDLDRVRWTPTPTPVSRR
ncbi:nuclear protein DGCR14 [Flammula alnicola]|nr:nuclear protein DGCR14 [Flammula alnicola]